MKWITNKNKLEDEKIIKSYEIIQDDPETKERIYLNKLELAYLLYDETEVYDMMKRDGYSLKEINTVTEKIKLSAIKNKQKYAHELEIFENFRNTRNKIIADYEKFGVTRKTINKIKKEMDKY